MTDVASLSFDIDSSQAQRAIAVLETLKASSISMGQAATTQGNATANLTQQYSQQRDQLDRLAQSSKAYDGTLSGLITRLDQMRRVMNDSREGMNGYAKILNQAASAAVTLNSTVDGLDRYIARARQLNIQSNDLATGLERITSALKNQTVAGNETLRMLTQMGINTAGMSANRPDEVLQQIAQQIRSHRMTATSVAQVQQILGPGFDAQAQTALGAQPYQTRYSAEAQERQTRQRGEIDATMQQVQRITADLQRSEDRRQDLMGRYTMNPGVLGRLGLNPSGATMSRDQQSVEYERIAGLPAEQRRQYETYGFQISNAVINNPISNAYRNFSSGTYSSRASEIDTRAEMESAATGWWSAQANRLGRRAENVIGQYTPVLQQDTRDLTPNDLRMLRGQSAGILAGYGDTALQNQVVGENRVTDFRADSSLQDRYRKAYGDTEGNRRYGLAGANLDLQAQYAKAPEQETVDAARREALIMALPEEQRQQARYNLSFAGQIGGAAAANLPVGTTLAGTTSRLNADQAGAAGTGYGQQVTGSLQQRKEEGDYQIKFQQGLTAALKDGRAAAEDYTRAETALHEARLMGVTDPAILKGIADKTAEVTQAQRISQGSAGNVDMERENRNKREQLELTKELNAVNATAEERQARLRQLGEQQQIRGGLDTGSLPKGDTPEARAVVAGRLAALQAQSPAQQAAADMVGELKGQLQDVEAINDIMVRQGATMEQATRELERQKTLNAAIAEAIHQGRLDDVARLEALKNQTLELTRQQTMETQRGRNMDATAQNEAEAAFNRHVYSLPIDQQAGEQAKKGAWIENWNSQRIPATAVPITPGSSTWSGSAAAEPYKDMLRVAAEKNHIPVEVLTQLIGGESGFRNINNQSGPGGAAASTAGGLGQQINGNVHLHGGNKFDPATSIEAAAEELAHRIRMAGGDIGVAASGYGSAPTAAARVAAAGGQTFNPRRRFDNESDDQYRARMARDASTDALTRTGQVGADLNAQRQFESQQAADRERGRLRASGQTGAAELVYTPDLSLAPAERANALRRQGQAGLAGQVDSANAMTGSTQRDIDDLNEMADAYKHGQAAVDTATAAQQAHTEALQFSKGVLDEEARKRQLLAEKLSREIVETSSRNLERGNEQGVQRGLNARGPFSDELDQRATERNIKTQQHFRDSPGLEQSPAGQQELANNKAQDAIDQQTRSMHELRDAAHSTEDALTSSLEAVVVHGEKGTEALKNLGKTLEDILFKTLVAKPFEHLMDSAMTSLFGGGSGSGSGSGSGTPGGGTANPGDGSAVGLGGQLLKAFGSDGGGGDGSSGGGANDNHAGISDGLGTYGSASGGVAGTGSSGGNGLNSIFGHAGGLIGWGVDKIGGEGFYAGGGLIGQSYRQWKGSEDLTQTADATPGGTGGSGGAEDTGFVTPPIPPDQMAAADAGIADSADAAAIGSADVMAAAFGGIFPGGQRYRSGYRSLIDHENTVVEAPTMFRFARGGAVGMMGEAGPEAIMPLRRGPDGRLGVSGGGHAPGAAPTINFHINTPNADSFRASQAQLHARAGAQINHISTRNAL